MDYNLKENFIPSLQQLVGLYNDVHWTNYTKTPERLMDAYNNSLYHITAWDHDKLIGAIRVVGDGCSIVYIQDLLVATPYQRLGIGTKLLQEVLCKYSAVYQTVLLTDDTPKTKAFYEHIGFISSEQCHCISFLKYHS